MSDVHLQVNGKRYGGWKSVQITRSIESIAGSFSLEVTDQQAGAAESWPIVEEDKCQVLIDSDVVVDGYVDRANPSFSATAKAVTISGRDRAAALVDCSAVLDEWAFKKATVVDIARKVAAPFGVSVSVQPGLELLKAPRKLVVNPGDSAFEVIAAAARAAGVLVVSHGAGGILITRSGTQRASEPLVQGVNLIEGSADYDATERFSRYIVMGQVGGSDNASGAATRIRAEAVDEGVRRTDRTLIIRPGESHDVAYARQLGDWEARIRAARGTSIEATVHGWRQSNGKLWPLNAIVRITSRTLRIDADMLITTARHVKSSAGETTGLRLVRPDAFTPEPNARVKG